jgi:bifunctional ADP-heptose synthase (sugar kinase/adenylyltransferase)
LGLRCVDEVIVSDSPTAVSVINKVKPNLYVKGIDYQNKDDDNLQAEREAVEANGGQLVFLATPKFSSSDVIARIRGK